MNAATGVTSDRSRLALLAAYVFLAVYLLPMFPHGGSDNELSRWATAVSLVETGSFDIGWSRGLIGANVDTARVGDRLYSNKAPGVALLATPVYAAVRIVVGPPDASNMRLSWYAMRLSLATLPLLALAVWLRRRGVGAHALAVVLFATPLFSYSLLLFSHVLAGVVLYAGFRLLYDRTPATTIRCLYGGAACGLAVVTEYPAIVAVAAFAFGLLFGERRGRLARFFAFVAGGAPFAAGLLVYNAILFGSPFTTAYAYESFPEWAQVASRGVFGIGLPTMSNLYLLLLSPARGLLFFAPILLLALREAWPHGAATLRQRVWAAALLLSLLALAGHGAAHGGWTPGPRYLVFLLPLLLDAWLYGERRATAGATWGFLFTVSLLLCLLPLLTFPFAPPEFDFPHNGLWFALLAQEAWFVPTLASVAGSAPGIGTIVPVLLAAVAVPALLARTVQAPRRFVAGALAAIVSVAAYVAWPGLDGGEAAALRRAGIAERYFRPAQRLDRFRALAEERGDADLARQVYGIEWFVAEVRSRAPDDFPYLAPQPLPPSPEALLRRAAELAGRGRSDEAIAVLAQGKARFPFAACDFAVNLAVLHRAAQRLDSALRELEGWQQPLGRTSPAACLRAQFLRAQLYRELDRPAQAHAIEREFLRLTEDSDDRELGELRRRLGAR